MRITASARRRDILDADIRHALHNYMRVYEDQGQVAMFIGPARDGTVLEIGVVLDDEDPRIIHAMRARAKYWPWKGDKTMKTKISDADAMARLEALDPATATVRDRSATADVRAAVQMREAAQGMVDQAVRNAREAGVTWIEIGLALGISPQGARQRYA